MFVERENLEFCNKNVKLFPKIYFKTFQKYDYNEVIFKLTFCSIKNGENTVDPTLKTFNE
jgi:hypothetical protein